MRRARASIAAVCAAAVMSGGIVLAQSPSRLASTDQQAKPGDPAKVDPLKVLRVSTGDTLPAKDRAGVYERVLLTAPDEAAMASGAPRELSFEEAVQLARLPKDERWRQLRQRLGLAPGDLLVWSEIVDAIFDSLKDVSLQPKSNDAEFGLQVAFPGTDTTNAKPEALLTLGKPTEGRMKDAVNGAATGIEAVVEVTGGDAADSADALRSMECQLLDRAKAAVGTAPVREGYCVFPDLKVNSTFGRETFYIRIVSSSQSVKVAASDPRQPAELAAYVLQDQRTRLTFKVALERSRGATPTTAATVTADPTSLISGFTKGLPLLDAVLQGLPSNPGLHIGAVETPDNGLQALFAVRYFLHGATIDRRALYVKNPHGTIRLQCLTPMSPDAEGQHYLKVVWSAHAEAAELNLSSRHVSRFPVGLSIGVVPALNPVMFTAGASFKIHPTFELVAAAGIRKNHDTAFVYGFAFDLQNVIALILGNPMKR